MKRVLSCAALLALAACGGSPAKPDTDPEGPAATVAHLDQAPVGLDPAALRASLADKERFDGLRDPKALEERFTSYRDLYRKVVNSVVYIEGRTFGKNTSSSGTGFVVHADGFIVTNVHVIAGADDYTVVFKDPAAQVSKFTGDYLNVWSRRAVVAAAHPSKDLALLRVCDPPPNLPVVTFSAPEEIEVAQEALAIGHPSDMQFRSNEPGSSYWDAAPGIIRNIQEKNGCVQVLRTTVPINPGNSGGPLFDLRGRVIGVNTWKAMPDPVSAAPADEDPKAAVVRLQKILENVVIKARNLGTVAWSIGTRDVLDWLTPLLPHVRKSASEVYPAEKAALPNGSRSIPVGNLPAGSKATFKFTFTDVKPLARIMVGYERHVVSIQNEKGKWLVAAPSGGKLVKTADLDLKPSTSCTLVLSRTASAFVVTLDGKEIANVSSGLPTGQFAWLLVRDLPGITIER